MINPRSVIATALLSLALSSAVAQSQTSASALQLTPHQVSLRADDNSRTTRTVYTTDGAAFLRAALPSLPEPNKSIVELMLDYPTDGSHTYWWPKTGGYDGCTTDVVVGGKTVMKGEPGARTFCCGLTLEVFYKYAASKPAVAAQLASNPGKFKGDWFCHNINSPGPLDALSSAKLGKKVTNLEEALPGDFVQLWRNDKSGHSVMFVNWLRDASGKRIGLQYWSTQTSTNGIGFSSEAFGNAPKQINIEHFSLTRPTV
jgi:hypothetical protein